MNIIDFATVQGLHQERTKLLDKLAVLEAKGFDLTTHFNVHFHGTAQSPEIAEIAAQPLRAHYRRLLAETDAKLTGLGVRVDQHDRLAELRPENFVPPPGAPAATGILSTDHAGDSPEARGEDDPARQLQGHGPEDGLTCGCTVSGAGAVCGAFTPIPSKVAGRLATRVRSAKANSRIHGSLSLGPAT